jgi:hypothetical protein
LESVSEIEVLKSIKEYLKDLKLKKIKSKDFKVLTKIFD